jgi:hypothetical protein
MAFENMGILRVVTVRIVTTSRVCSSADRNPKKNKDVSDHPSGCPLNCRRQAFMKKIGHLTFNPPDGNGAGKRPAQTATEPHHSRIVNIVEGIQADGTAKIIFLQADYGTWRIRTCAYTINDHCLLFADKHIKESKSGPGKADDIYICTSGEKFG